MQEFPPLEGVLFPTETPGRLLEEGKEPSRVLFFSRMCVFLLSKFSLVAAQQSVLLWSRFSNRRHSVCTGSSCPWPKPTDPQQRRTRSSIASAFSWHRGRAALPQPHVVSLQLSCLSSDFAAPGGGTERPLQHVFHSCASSKRV